jgi:alkanesulfonate monooxygenase SsuD/methylene tetrahydromethanopterin reductase-like flavin-dependent oxidoreductase (luciferase family)
MDFGLQLAGMPTRVLIDAARRAEDLGFAAVYVPDHLANEPPGAGRLDDQTPMWEALSILGAIAASTSRVRLGGHVLLVAKVEQRYAVGRGLDNGRRQRVTTRLLEDQHEVDQREPESAARLRGEHPDESIRVIKSLWTESRTNFAGEFYQLRDAFLTAKPVQEPHPPVLFGGSGKGLLRIAAREADVVNVIVDTGRAGTVLTSEIAKLTEDGFRAKLDFVRRRRDARPRADPSTTVFVMAITETSAQAAQIAAGMAAGFGLAEEGPAHADPLSEPPTSAPTSSVGESASGGSLTSSCRPPPGSPPSSASRPRSCRSCSAPASRRSVRGVLRRSSAARRSRGSDHARLAGGDRRGLVSRTKGITRRPSAGRSATHLIASIGVGATAAACATTVGPSAAR